MNYFYDNEGSREEVKIEAWAWEVVYADGSVLRQFDEGTFHRFQEICQEKVAEFRMVRTDGSGACHRIYPSPGMKIFHYYSRNCWHWGTAKERKATTYVFGYKEAGKPGVYHYILPTGNLLIGTDGAIPFAGDLARMEVEAAEARSVAGKVMK